MNSNNDMNGLKSGRLIWLWLLLLLSSCASNPTHEVIHRSQYLGDIKVCTPVEHVFSFTDVYGKPESRRMGYILTSPKGEKFSGVSPKSSQILVIICKEHESEGQFRIRFTGENFE